MLSIVKVQITGFMFMLTALVWAVILMLLCVSIKVSLSSSFKML